MIAIELPWPSADLSPNARLHRMAHARAKKKAKNDAWGLTKQLLGALRIAPNAFHGPIKVHTVFHQPAGYRYDEDGLNSRMKSAWDGIAMAIAVDDNLFRHTHERGENRPPKGCVVVHLTPALVDVPVVGVVS